MLSSILQILIHDDMLYSFLENCSHYRPDMNLQNYGSAFYIWGGKHPDYFNRMMDSTNMYIPITPDDLSYMKTTYPEFFI